MDQEIEVIATDFTSPAAAAPLTSAAPPVVDVYSAAAYGDLPKLRAFVEQDGHSVAKPDGSGYFALQWAALNNYADAAQYIIEHGGEVNAADNTQQTALHWAAVRGSVAAADVLLQKGARVEAADLNGYRDPLLNIDLNGSSIWTGNWSQLCPTCKIIRPVRSKHCPSCKHCVEQFDHHCPWISNCVGKKNKWDFFVFICMGTLAAFLSAAVAFHRVWTASPVLPSSGTWFRYLLTEHPGAVTFLVFDVLLFSGAFALTVVQMSQIARNITTNELANAARYSYLRGPEGRFRNPYNHGFRKNCTDFLVHGYMDDAEIAWPPLQQSVR